MFKKFIRLLAVTKPPKNKSVVYWKPFTKGKNLGEIIDTYNSECERCYMDHGMTPPDVEKYGEGIRLDLHHLDNAMDELGDDDFDALRIFLLNLDELPLITSMLSWIKERANAFARGKKWQVYHVVPVSSRGAISSLVDVFKGTPVNVYDVVHNQAALENFLIEKFCGLRCGIIHQLMPNEPEGGTSRRVTLGSIIGVVEEARQRQLKVPLNAALDPYAAKRYRNDISHIADEVRAVALSQDLSDDEVAELARQAGVQEFMLADFASQVRPPAAHVVYDPLRQSPQQFISKSFNPNNFLKKNVLQVQLTQSVTDLTPEQRLVTDSLGLDRKGSAALVYDSKTLRKSLNALADVLEVSTVKLPESLVKKIG